MTRRLFYVALGATVGVLVVRRASQAAAKLTPVGVQNSLAGAFAGLSDSIRDFTGEMRLAMAEREAELREGLGLDGTNDAIDAHSYRP
jgi:hypothetical protein